MSGVPQALFQWLAQELRRPVRLESAEGPTPAITLEMEDAAAAQAEVENQPPPEIEPLTATLQLLWPEHPFRRRPANPTPPIDEAAGPATYSAQPPAPGAERPSATETWPEVRDELRTSRAEFIQARSRIQAAMEALDGFLLEHLQEGAELAGKYPQRVADERAAQAAYRAEHNRRPARISFAGGTGQSPARWLPAINRFRERCAAEAA